jgi:hypothetical protein
LHAVTLDPHAVVVNEGSTVTLDGTDIGVASIFERDYAAGGEQLHGLTAMLHFVDDTNMVAGAGTLIGVGVGSWRVAAVTAGSIEFHRTG